MIKNEQIDTLIGRDVYDRDNHKIGSIGQVWSDAAGRPAWASVRTGLFGLKESLLPLPHADLRGDDVVVPIEKARVKDAPNVDASHDEPLTEAEVDRLYEHYGLSWESEYQNYSGGKRSDDYAGTGGATARTESTTARTDGAMTRSEERLNVDTRAEEAGKARLRKYVVTEREQVSVPVQHEEARLEREPITDANRDAALAGPDITESEYEVTLNAERPVVETEAVPVERVSLGKETVTEQQQVDAEVRKERVEADLPDEKGRRRLG